MNDKDLLKHVMGEIYDFNNLLPPEHKIVIPVFPSNPEKMDSWMNECLNEIILKHRKFTEDHKCL